MADATEARVERSRRGMRCELAGLSGILGEFDCGRTIAGDRFNEIV